MTFRPAHMYFDDQAARTPDAPAVVFEGTLHSYRELADRSNQLANFLRSRGVKADTAVGIRMRRGVDHLVGLLGVHKAGATLVPVSSVSAMEPPERMAYILERAGIELILTQRELGEVSADIPHVAIEDIVEFASTSVTHTVDADDLAYVIFTSGSTGKPKGCAMPHRGLHNLIEWQVEYSPGSSELRTLQFNGLGFDLCFQEIFPTWAAGGVLVVMPESARRDPLSLLDLVISQRVGRMILPFVAFRQLAEQAELGGRAVPDLREVYVGGEALQLTPAIRSLFRSNPGASLINVYGPTEAHIVTAYRVPGAPETWPAVAPIGLPIRGVRMYVVNRAGQSVPAGAPGEVLIGGAALVRGYLHNPRATAERFIPDRFAKIEGARVYRTGDLVRKLPSGALEFVGRTDHQVKIRGFRVEPGEVEMALAGHPSVRQVVVQGRNDTNETRLVAYLVPREAAPSSSELRAFLATKLPDEMIPSVFVVLHDLPLTPEGKVDLKALPAPGTERLGATADDEYVAPTEGDQRKLAELWQAVLALDRVGATDNFFEIGGHSLLAFQITARIREQFGVQLAIVEIFQSPTVADLANVIRRARTHAPLDKPPLVATVDRAAEHRVSATQQIFVRMNQEAPNIPLENQDASLRIQGPLDVAALEYALGEIIERHDVLRDAFRRGEGGVLQRVQPVRPFELAVRDVPSWDDAVRARVTEWSRSFDLERGPPVRFQLLRINAEDHLLVALFHHAIFDGTSYWVYFRELGALYSAARAAEPSPLPRLPIQFADFVAWQYAFAELPAGQAQLAYWRTRIDGSRATAMRGDQPGHTVEEKWQRKDKPTMAWPARSLPLSLPSELVVAVKRQAQLLQVTPFAVLAAAYFLLIREASGQRDLLILSTYMGRDQEGTQALLGQFNNPLPIRLTVADTSTARDLIAAVRDESIAQRRNADLPACVMLGALDRATRVVFNFLPADANVTALPTLPGCAVFWAPEHEENVLMNDFGFFMAETATTVTASVIANAELFTEQGVQNLIDRYIALVTWMTQRPEAAVTDILDPEKGSDAVPERGPSGQRAAK